MWNIWLERFVTYMRQRNFSERTPKDYSCQLRFFFQYLSSRGIDKISRVTKEVLQDYQNHLFYYERNGKKLSFATQRSRLGVVQSFFRWLTRADYIPYDPSSTLQLPKRKKLLPRGIMSPKDVSKVLETPKGDDPLSIRDRAILEVLYGTAVRNAELRSLTIFDADLRAEQLRIRGGKGKKDRIVPLGECASYCVSHYLKEGRPKLIQDSSQTLLFVTKNGKQLTAAVLIWIVRKYTKRAKLSKEITPHSFRHSCASHMLQNRADLRHIQEMLGHGSVETTQIYTKVELSNLKEVHSRCHPRRRMGFTR